MQPNEIRYKGTHSGDITICPNVHLSECEFSNKDLMLDHISIKKKPVFRFDHEFILSYVLPADTILEGNAIKDLSRLNDHTSFFTFKKFVSHSNKQISI